MKRNKKAVVLLSGGLDSATSLYIAKNKGYRVHCLIFDYGQRQRREIESARRIADRLNCPYKVIKLDFPCKGSSLLDKKLKIPPGRPREGAVPNTYVPGRNIIFLSYAVSFAESIGASAVYIGAHARDYSGYPDCRPEFYRAFNRAVYRGTRAGIRKKELRVMSPLINKTKGQIINSGIKLGVPFELTWSCYRGGKYPCGNCDSCYFRSKGFREAGKKDPLLLNGRSSHSQGLG